MRVGRKRRYSVYGIIIIIIMIVVIRDLQIVPFLRTQRIAKTVMQYKSDIKANIDVICCRKKLLR